MTGYKSPRIDPLRKINEYFPSKGVLGVCPSSSSTTHSNSSVVVTQLQFGRSSTVESGCQTDVSSEEDTDSKETQILREVRDQSGVVRWVTRIHK